MSRLKKAQGTVVKFGNGIYTVKVDNKVVTIPSGVMHRCVEFPSDMLEDGHLKMSCELALVRKDDSTYYPDHTFYPTAKNSLLGIQRSSSILFPGQKQSSAQLVDGSYLLTGVPSYVEVKDYETFMAELSALLPLMPNDKRGQVLVALTSTDSDTEKMKAIMKIVPFPVKFTESTRLEKKSSLFFPASKSQLEKDRNAQLKEVADSVIAFCNSKERRPCHVIVGIFDETNEPSGLQNEIATRYPGMSLDKFQSTVLVPFFLSYTGNNASLMASLDFEWYNISENLVLIIDINYTGAPVVVKGGRLPYRCGTSKSVAEMSDMVSYIMNFSK